MAQWFYEKNGQQQGPVTLEQLQRYASDGEIATTNLVWNETLPAWTAAGQIADLTNSFPSPTAPSDPSAATGGSSNPYAAPQSSWMAPSSAHANPLEGLSEIIPGSERLDGPACIKRGWDLMLRNAGIVALAMLVSLGCTWAASILIEAITVPLSMATTPENVSTYDEYALQEDPSYLLLGVTIGLGIINQIFTMYINLGMLRVWLNLASGKAASVGMIFGEGRKLFVAIVASIIYGLAVSLGLILLIVPGIYIALRYGHYMNAIVDKNLGIMESLHYSSNLTTGNRMPLFVLAILCILVMLAGFLAFCVGIFVAIPIVSLAAAVSYRWMQYGHRVVIDQPA
jgi:hypothetical protein